MRRFAFLGPSGTFTESALDQVADPAEAERVAVSSVHEALHAVADERVDAAMIALENSIEGGVTSAQDALAKTPGLRILSEHLVQVNFALVAPAGTNLADIETIAAHPVAYAQCAAWLAANLSGAVHLPAASNVAAARDLGVSAAQAAISTPRITEVVTGLDVLATDIANTTDAQTRFVLVGRGPELPKQTGADKTSLIVELASDRAGSLLDVLEQFATRGVNLSLIQSRPIGDRLGRYRFVIDVEGHIRDERVAAAMLGLKRVSPKVTFLGSYARADRQAPVIPDRFSDASFEDARDWLREILTEAPVAQ
ncbi:prephenate dehydratase [uncultured Agrococcus sp.]|uniref:prephenate dehydratase n=1 Tax=uncultured Agrococcus sp. TaxID=382258 RepID=UPI0025DD1868|nr:prephenate dehydratase [uncultured Agrococcus sp.]